MVKPFFNMENWESSAFRPGSTAHILSLLLGLKGRSIKCYDLFKVIGSLKTLTFVSTASVTSHPFFLLLQFHVQITILSCSGNLI
jgi:hypothetical protein